DNDMVRFVNFADTAATHKADTIAAPSMLMTLNALVDIRQGSTVTVDRSSDGQNRAQIKGEGILDYSMSPAQPDGRLTGRFTINSGFFRYSLPVISEKNFSFNQGSYVAFNGPILNPTLNIYATDDIKANVTRSGENSRLVIFDVILGVTGTLERMDVAFDLETNDDITVQNELRSMSATQRANQAMNLLLYGVYTGQGTTGNANLSGNALYGFLTSQLNTWAANTIKGVDLSFGMDQYDRTRDGSTSTATQYSYQLSKSLFNDRFKIVVGGNYSTDANAEENFAQNLISDISFEYMLNDAGSMYVRLFRHTGYESILEGEVTQTGVGFVMRRKIRSLRDLFIFRKKSAPKK
ncbi:MAG: translocation/assembly module TamB, partial [Muribaculaceae bacterium]|nr:translocation/assembly module TamB [Muribaculaceae bacterium]